MQATLELGELLEVKENTGCSLGYLFGGMKGKLVEVRGDDVVVIVRINDLEHFIEGNIEKFEVVG